MSELLSFLFLSFTENEKPETVQGARSWCQVDTRKARWREFLCAHTSNDAPDDSFVVECGFGHIRCNHI